MKTKVNGRKRSMNDNGRQRLRKTRNPEQPGEREMEWMLSTHSPAEKIDETRTIETRTKKNIQS